MYRVLMCAAAALFISGQAVAQTPSPATPKGVIDDIMVPSSDPGIEIYVRNKRPADMASFRPESTALYVHGAGFPSSVSFDFKLDGMISWMDYIVAHGYDVYLMDIRGFGKSTRPKEMAEKPEANLPLVRSDAWLKDISSVVDFILRRRNISRLDLIGWSWGANMMATYTTQNPGKVERLVLYAPGWIVRTPFPPPGSIPAYVMWVKNEHRQTRWLPGLSDDKKAMLTPSSFEALIETAYASDPVGSLMDPPVLRLPNGFIQDFFEYWNAGRAYYDPAKITVPTLVVGAEWDNVTPPYMRQTLFPLLSNAPGKRYVELAEGAHSIMMEKNRLQLFKAVQSFLDDTKVQ